LLHLHAHRLLHLHAHWLLVAHRLLVARLHSTHHWLLHAYAHHLVLLLPILLLHAIVLLDVDVADRLGVHLWLHHLRLVEHSRLVADFLCLHTVREHDLGSLGGRILGLFFQGVSIGLPL